MSTVHGIFCDISSVQLFVVFALIVFGVTASSVVISLCDVKTLLICPIRICLSQDVSDIICYACEP